MAYIYKLTALRGLSPISSKVAAVKEVPTSTNVQELHAFLELVN